jgi:hypothetical protein
MPHAWHMSAVSVALLHVCNEKCAARPNLTPLRETRAAAVLPARPSRPVRTSTVTPARPANAHARGARRANHAVMAYSHGTPKKKPRTVPGLLRLRILERDDFSSNRHPALSFCLSMISAQTLRVCREGKPVTTHRVVARGHAFPDHALASISTSQEPVHPS